MTKNTSEKSELKPNSWYLYLVREKNNALYCGITTDVQRRFAQHKAGTGAKALKGKMPLTLAFSCLIGSRSAASQMEYQIKQLNKKAKEKLVIDQPDDIIAYLAHAKLSKCEE
ncbi:GIY-YIG nuclease family protein [Providencia rettgeri]|uniref:GIY-YIG nuclease family protein n=1 Tax=Providencia rettgeri TaxID=587 RepID=UPI0034E076F0